MWMNRPTSGLPERSAAIVQSLLPALKTMLLHGQGARAGETS
jgi:hypothetical protein